MSSTEVGGRVPTESRLHRSFLYAPGTRPELMIKALTAGADAVVLDLEDSVVPQRRDEARANVAEMIAAPPADAADIMVRVSRVQGGYSAEDVDATVGPGLSGLRLPKAEHPDEIAEVAELVAALERERGMEPGTVRFDITIESALGAIRIAELLRVSDRVSRAGIGVADLLADIGAVGDDDLATLHVRSHLVMQSRAVGAAPPIDSVHVAVDDIDGVRAGARRARALGFFGKSIIHPRHIDPVHEVFTPTEAELDRARRIIDSYRESVESGTGGLVIDGDFLDVAVVARAHAILNIGEE